MSDRSELIAKILRIWDYSDEGQKYLEWLLRPQAQNLDGGAVLREAVLDVMEEDEQLNELRRQKQEEALQNVLSRVSPEVHAQLLEATDDIAVSLREQEESWRSQAKSLREIRHTLNWDRLETLEMVFQIRRSRPPDALVSFLEQHEIAQEVASKITALARTRAAKIDVEAEWRAHSSEEPLAEMVQEMANDPGESWFDNHREKLDRYYAQDLVTKLDGVINRSSALAALNLEVRDPIVSRFFQEAHDAFLYGFDSAAIALCRSLIEHALKERLSIRSRKMLGDLIKLAEKRKLLRAGSIKEAGKVQNAGNKIMHDVANLQHTAQVVLDCTRNVLNELYGAAATP